MPIVNARTVRSGWGVNCGDSDINAANALKFIGTRWVRMQFDGDNTSTIQTLQNNLVASGAADPTLKLNLLLNGYNQNAAANNFNNQKSWILNGLAPIKGPTGKMVLQAIEGPNEMNSVYTGGGTRGPYDTIDKTGNGSASVTDPVCCANFVDWAQQLYNFKQANLTALSTVELCSPTVLDFDAQNWSTNLNVASLVDYGTFHYYSGINGTNGCPSYPPNPTNFYFMYGFAQAGICPGKALIQTEGGLSSQTGGGYAQDGRSACRYQIMQILDHHARGGHRYMIYNLRNNSVSTSTNVTNYNEDNFGQYYGDWVAKPVATALHNLSNLLSLNNNYADAANLTDTANFSPAYTGTGFSVSGLTSAGSAGSSLIMPKSDGSTMIAVWNEPTIDSGSGTSTSVASNAITVNFGSSQTYKVYDPMGGGNVNNFTVSTSLTPITTGSGSSVALTLFGNPLFIELSGAPAPTQVPGAVVASASGTTATELTLTWPAATNSPTDYLITVTEVT